MYNQGSSGLHKKGSRQKFKRQNPQSQQLSSSEHLAKERSDSFVGGPGVEKEKISGFQLNAQTGSDSSRKDSNENEYEPFWRNEENFNNYGSSYQQQKEKKKGYGYNKGPNADYRELAGNYYQASGKQGKNMAGKDLKGSGYSSGASSGSSYKGSYQTGYNQEHYYYNQFSAGAEGPHMKGGQNKYKKPPGYYGGDKYGSHFPEKNMASNNEFIPSLYIDGDQISVPIFQPLMVFSERQEELIEIQKYLFELASQGELLIEQDLFKQKLMEILSKPDWECNNLIDYASSEQIGIINQTVRKFASKKVLSFVSLKLDIISHQCLHWAIVSLKKDEMTPTERTIQNRIKEAFAFKFLGPLWEYIMESIEQGGSPEYQALGQNQFRQVKYNSSAFKVVTVPEYSSKPKAKTYNDYYGSQKPHPRLVQYVPNQRKPQDQKFEFLIKEIEEDPSIGQMTKVIYLKSEDEWVGVDQNSEEIDYQLYLQLKEFLYNYFCNNQMSQDEEGKWCSSIENSLTKSHMINPGFIKNSKEAPQTQSQLAYHEAEGEDVRAIPGGRYGCAQFVKICGPPSLKEKSLGKLAQLVQYAVKEDVLRYHKTLLVWTTTVDKHKKQAEDLHKESNKNAHIELKLQQVKLALVDILRESKNGMSLAQLPLYLRKKLDFALDLNELGFPKLKDLILSMNDHIKLELRGINHPFAYLITSNRSVHSKVNSDDFQNIPQKKFIQKGNNLSEDANSNRHPKNALAMGEIKIKQIQNIFVGLMRERPRGIYSDQLPQCLSEKMGFEFNLKDFNCSSLLEFLHKYIMTGTEIEFAISHVNKDIYMIMPKQFIAPTYFEFQRQQNTPYSMYMMDPFQNANSTFYGTSMNYSGMQYEPQGRKEQLDSGSSMNYSAQMYIPNSQSLYGGSNSGNNSTQQNVGHFRANTAEAFDAQFNPMQMQQPPNQHYYAQYKPPLPPSSQAKQGMPANQSTMMSNFVTPQVQTPVQTAKRNPNYGTYPPNIAQQQQFISHHHSVSNFTNQSAQSFGFSQYPIMQNGGFYFSPNQAFSGKMEDQQQFLVNSPSHMRAISQNQMFFGSSPGAVHSTISKSASQDFSIQSQFMQQNPSMQTQKVSHSGVITPQMQHYNRLNYNPSLANKGQLLYPQSDSIFESPIPNYQGLDASSLRQTHYQDFTPSQDHEEEEGNQHRKFIEKLVDDELVSNMEEQSYHSMQSPELNASLSQTRQAQAQIPSQFIIPNMMQMSRQTGPSGGLGVMGLMGKSHSNQALPKPIMEGGSSSSEENKRPSVVQERKTEEDDDEDNENQELTQQYKNMGEQKEGDCSWSNDVKLF